MKIISVNYRKITILTAICIVIIIDSSGIETQKTTEKSYTFSQNSQIERIVKVPLQGSAIDHLWSPRAKYESTKVARAAKANKSFMYSSTKRSNLRRRLFSIPGSDSPSRQQIPNAQFIKTFLSISTISSSVKVIDKRLHNSYHKENLNKLTIKPTMNNLFLFFSSYVQNELNIINDNIHDITNLGYTYFFLAILIKIFRGGHI